MVFIKFYNTKIIDFGNGNKQLITYEKPVVINDTEILDYTINIQSYFILLYVKGIYIIIIWCYLINIYIYYYIYITNRQVTLGEVIDIR